MNSDNSVLIEYEDFRLPTQEGPYIAGTNWADPSISNCADQLESIINNNSLYDKLRRMGKDYVKSNFSPYKISRKLEKILINSK